MTRLGLPGLGEPIWEFSKIGSTLFWGVLIIRILLFKVLY